MMTLPPLRDRFGRAHGWRFLENFGEQPRQLGQPGGLNVATGSAQPFGAQPFDHRGVGQASFGGIAAGAGGAETLMGGPMEQLFG